MAADEMNWIRCSSHWKCWVAVKGQSRTTLAISVIGANAPASPNWSAWNSAAPGLVERVRSRTLIRDTNPHLLLNRRPKPKRKHAECGSCAATKRTAADLPPPLQPDGLGHRKSKSSFVNRNEEFVNVCGGEIVDRATFDWLLAFYQTFPQNFNWLGCSTGCFETFLFPYENLMAIFVISTLWSTWRVNFSWLWRSTELISN